MMYFPAHLIHGPHAPRPSPTSAQSTRRVSQSPLGKPAADVPLPMFQAAQACGAMCLSADGRTAYTRRYGTILRCFWDDEARDYGGWFESKLEDWPGEAVRM